VGCVLVDSRGRVLSTGYNGVAASLPHCTDVPCGGSSDPAGSDTCQAVHAELNALLDCRDTTKIHTCYTSTMPCNNCMKTLLNTSCQRIVYLNDHESGQAVREQWLKAGRSVVNIDEIGVI
jgi:dCMP deaminase